MYVITLHYQYFIPFFPKMQLFAKQLISSLVTLHTEVSLNMDWVKSNLTVCISHVTFLLVCVCVFHVFGTEACSSVRTRFFCFLGKARCYRWVGSCSGGMLSSWKPWGGVDIPQMNFPVGERLCILWPSLCLCDAKQFKKRGQTWDEHVLF